MIRFMSKAAASFVMLDATAKDVLKAAGFDWANQGIWRVERLDEVIAKLQQAHDLAATQSQRQEQAQGVGQPLAAVQRKRGHGGPSAGGPP